MYSGSKERPRRSWLKEWPVRLAIVAFILNMEIVVIPLAKYVLGLAGTKLYIMAAVCSTVEMVVWANLVFWLIRRIKKHEQMREAIIVSKTAASRFKEAAQQSGYMKWWESWVEENIIDRFSPKHHEKKKVFHWLRILGFVFGWPLVLVLGTLPVIWIVCLVFCCLRYWRWGFVALFLGNLVKNIGFASIWDYIWTLF